MELADVETRYRQPNLQLPGRLVEIEVEILRSAQDDKIFYNGIC